MYTPPTACPTGLSKGAENTTSPGFNSYSKIPSIFLPDENPKIQHTLFVPGVFERCNSQTDEARSLHPRCENRSPVRNLSHLPVVWDVYPVLKPHAQSSAELRERSFHRANADIRSRRDVIRGLESDRHLHFLIRESEPAQWTPSQPGHFSSVHVRSVQPPSKPDLHDPAVDFVLREFHGCDTRVDFERRRWCAASKRFGYDEGVGARGLVLGTASLGCR
ncbi:hypothetical protein BJ742DRAFT_739865 [Cladochytrium replicatum]|nr:hypothetical protein BJ742DRAFT_739865 [Cladochytrium replicatum]